MIQPQQAKRYRCRFRGQLLSSWLPVQRDPDGAMLVGHLSQRHPTEVGTFLEQMCGTEDIAQVAAQTLRWWRTTRRGKSQKARTSDRMRVTLDRARAKAPGAMAEGHFIVRDRRPNCRGKRAWRQNTEK